MEDSSIDKTMKPDTAEHPPSGKAEAHEVAAENVPGPAAEKKKKKKTKVMRFRMTPGQIERELSVRMDTTPMPTFPEKALALTMPLGIDTRCPYPHP